MRGTILTLLSLGAAIIAPAQFYPGSNAAWCLRNVQSPDGFDIFIQMSGNPDTVVMGQTYKRVREYHDRGDIELINRYYVRSSPDGKGYAFLLDSMAEYITGDLHAQAGDTVHGVLVFDRYCGWGYNLLDIIVDSVATLSNMGVTATRQYVRTPCYPIGNYSPSGFFWQGGLGTAYGPLLRVTPGLSADRPRCAVVRDTTLYAVWPGEIGGPPCCSPPVVGMEMEERPHPERLVAMPNPSTGAFQLGGSAMGETRVHDAYGREVLVTRDRTIDLTAHPPGVYTAVVSTAVGWHTLRLVVVR